MQTVVYYLPGIIILILSMLGCSSKDLYEGVQSNQRFDCSKEYQPSEYDDCIQRTKVKYEEYEEKRKQVLESK